MTWREIGPNLRELWHRPAGPMNWKNPIRVLAVLGWLVVQGFVLLGWAGWRVFQGLMLLGWAVFRVAHFVVRLPALVLFFFGGVWYAVWSFVRRPFPSLDEHPILALVQYHTPDFFSFMVLWYYLSPFVAVMLSGAYFRHRLEGLAGRAAARFRALRQAPAVAAFSRPKDSGHRHRRGPSPGRGAGDFQSLVAHHPGARTVYRRGDLRSRGIGGKPRLA